MTNDELMEKIDETINDSPVTDPQHPTYLALDALRAVIELEKVVPSFNIDKELYEMPIDTALQIAYAHGFIDSREKVIQAIEKELV
jgi:hypothetical protein